MIERGAVAVQARHGYIISMRFIFLAAPLFLAACTLPGRETLSPNPAGADTATIQATQAFSGRIPLVTILPGTTDFAGPVADAVKQARAIKPDAAFNVEAQAPQSGTPDANAQTLSELAPTASAVAKAIIADGVDASRVTLTAKTAGLDASILVYVK